MFKKVFAVVLCLVMLMSTATISASVSADEAKTVVDGIRWFPCEPGRENDIMWEVECLKEGCGCQGFLENETTTGNKNFLDTVYGEDGSLTITRNGNDGQGDLYWPRIRTIMMDQYPELDLQVANTLYFDFEATNANWNIMLGINGMTLKLSKVIADAAGVAGVANSDADGPAGAFKGKVDLQAAIAELAAESGTESSAFAGAVQNMKTTYVPQISIFCVGAVGASVKINSLFISTPDDAEGAKCDYLDMGLIMGDEYYELQDEPAADEPAADTEEPAADDEPAADTEEPADEPADDADDKKDDDKKDDKKDSGSSSTLIIIIVAAVVVIAVAVVVVIVLKKKKAA